MTRKTLLLLVCIVGCALAADPAPTDESAISVRGVTWPGGPMFISVDCPEGTTGTWYWAGRNGAMTPAPYGLRCGLAVPLDASVGGTATLKVTLKDEEGNKTELSRKILVDNKWRPTQYLSMSASDDAKYTDPQADKEEEIVLAKLRDLLPGPRFHGDFLEPSDGPRTSPYGVRRVRNGRTAGFHRGLDYAPGYGAPVTAGADGVVTLVGKNYTLLGNCVIINHGEGLTSLFLHLSAFNVKEGQTIKAGQVVGKVGTTGASTGPHLHYATYFHGEPIDPDQLLHIPAEWAPDAR
ncbi:MAG: M23 family metallopeptidase [Candidatus Eremiobacteraeota bacterium]|nr:M23 family metallopeptidase [Candidatus Eremiobacteraeota bacterium]